MKKNKSAKPTKTSAPRPRSSGTAVLGVVLPELAVSGVFGVSASDASFIANSIAKAILTRFTIDQLQAAGILGGPGNGDD